MSYQERCIIAQQANSPYTCCVGCIRSNGTRPFYSCGRIICSSSNEDEDEDFPPMPAPIQRQTTQWIVNGQIIYNGNPNGNRLLNSNVNDNLNDVLNNNPNINYQ